jgi:hypothetical protein
MSGLEILPIMAIGGSIASATSSVMAGNERARAARFEAEQYRIQEQSARTAAIQDETQRREEFRRSVPGVASAAAVRPRARYSIR